MTQRQTHEGSRVFFFLLTFHAKALQVLVQGRDKRIVRSQVNFIPGALDNSKPIFLQAEVRVRESALSGRIYSRLSLLVHFVFSSIMMREGSRSQEASAEYFCVRNRGVSRGNCVAAPQHFFWAH